VSTLFNSRVNKPLGDNIMDRQDNAEDTMIYKVVINHEDQYSIYPAHRDNPLGWQEVGKIGLKVECLEYIKQVWQDMRPLSLRKKMDESARKI
jgi:MbtH protein